MATMRPNTKERDSDVRAVAYGLGEIFAQIYVVLGRSLRQSHGIRKKSKLRGLKLWQSVPAEARYDFLVRNQALVEDGLRRALTGKLRQQAKKHLGLSEKELKHIALRTHGNPDFQAGVGGVTTNGTALVGPTVTVKDGSAQITFGAGPEVDYQGAKKGLLAGEDIIDVAGNAIKGAGAWIGIRIEC